MSPEAHAHAGKMDSISDPARELADLCEKLVRNTETKGDQYLAERFKTEAWSAEFFEIIFAIVERVEFLKKIVPELDMDSDIKSEATAHLSQIQQAFTPNGLNNQWKHASSSYIDPSNSRPVKMLSSAVRQRYPIPKLSADDQKALLDELGELLKWLKEHQLQEKDFIRQAIIEGVEKFKFRLERLEWIGWADTLKSFRDVLSAYFALERGFPDTNVSPEAGAALLKLKAFALHVFEKIKFAKDVAETGDFALRLYGATVLLLQSSDVIKGLLQHG